jgi:nucleoside-diphosphate-sugar epimerase
MGKKVIITGSTGMVGEGVMLVCLNSPEIDKVLIINRKTVGYQHPKLEEIIVDDFNNLPSIEQKLTGYDACFHCMGITSVGTEKQVYHHVTYELTILLAKTFLKTNKTPDFIYVSGYGTDEKEQAKMEWARIKGRTENELAAMPFRKFYAYRPGFIKPYPGQKYAHPYYKYVNWMLPFGRLIHPDGFNTMEELGESMIQLVLHPAEKKIIKGSDIKLLSRKLHQSQ